MNWTEDEAKTKWCPASRASNGRTAVGTTVNRGTKGAPDPECFCLGSRCMAWRIAREATEMKYERFVGAKPPGAWELVRAMGDAGTENYEWRREAEPAYPAYGYCGLAGRP